MLRLAKDVASEIGKNVAMKVPAIRRWRVSRPRTGERFSGKPGQLRLRAFQALDALRAADVDVSGLRVIEIGPGDFLTSGMAIVAAGADHYASMDRFAGDYSRLEGKEWYAGIEQGWSEYYPDLEWPEWLHAESFPEGYVPERVNALNAAVEEIADLGEPFDVLCSFQVAEHVSDLKAFVDTHRRLLKPGGVAVHRVDFGAHGVWYGYPDPLTFLRFSDPLWKAMGSARGTPNRYRIHELVEAFEKGRFAAELRDVNTVTRGEVRLARLGRRFREMPIESLLTDSATLVVRV
ncbi:MAG: hypothetical protein DLM58_13670 [Pseudonocardiales bacterium]|nr:MAG: hypothetical protein DLM58_13670 [Pseudonocardiales bacterium]